MIGRFAAAMRAIAVGLINAVVIASLWAGPSIASQNSLVLPTTGTLAGLTAVNDINNANDSLNTCNSGGSAPTNQLSGGPSAGNCWYNTSTGAVQYYDGTDWLTVGYIDATNHVFTPVTGGNAAATVASATTTGLCGSSGAAPIGGYLTISGTTTITGFGSNCVVGQHKIITFSGILTLTYNSTSLILPGGASITTAAGDVGVAIYLGSGNWKVAIYQTQSGVSPGAASLLATDQTLSGGANVTSFSIGTISSGTTTVDCGKSPLQYLTDGGAFTLAAPSNDGSCVIKVTNNTTAGTISFSGFTVGGNIGDALNTTNTDNFLISITRINSVATYYVKALQ